MADSRRLLISIAVMSATVMQVLDTTIVNVALPHMEGQLGATPEQISWVLTSYLVASAIFMPLTGYFSDRLGRRRYLLISITGFVISSMLCGVSLNLGEIVLARLMQGVFGAALVPLSQAIMVDTYPLNERGKAMAIWGLGVMVGPILGPTLGGYLTQVLSWRYTFFINLPVGILSLVLAFRVVPDTPRRARDMDWTGFVFLSVFIGGLQFLLDRGNQDGWLSSSTIRIATAASALGLMSFVFHALTSERHPLFRLGLFRDRNFTIASIVLAIFGLGMYGSMVLQPMMLESLLHYPTLTTGLAMAPRGIVSAVSMLVVGRLITKFSPRLLISAGIVFSTLGSLAMTHYDLHIGIFTVIWPILIQGLGLGMIYVPLSTIAFSTLPSADSTEAAGLFSLMRTIGSSIGISIVTTAFTQETQVAWNQMGGHINPFNPALKGYLAPLGLTPDSTGGVLVLAHELARQAAMRAFIDSFMLVTVSFVFMLPLTLLLKGGPLKGGAEAAVAGE
ncbi:MAG: DHA2 family efflux MFS transporter permease subunit [Acidiferrobacteraceae bacterium]